MLKWLLLVAVVLISSYFIYNYYMTTTTDAKAPVTGDYAQASVATNHLDEELTRDFTYYKPKKLVSDPAIVFVLHGSRGIGDKIRFQSGYQYDYLAEETGEFIVVYPNGYLKSLE